MLLEDLLVQLKRLSDIRRALAEIIGGELGKIRFLFDKIRVVVDGVHDDVEEGNCATGVLGVLLHEEDVLADLVGCAGLGLLFLVIPLKLVDFEEEDEAEDWLAQHFLRPLFDGEEVLDGIFVGVEAQLLQEGGHDLRVGLHGQPVVLLFLLLHFTLALHSNYINKPQIIRKEHKFITFHSTR